MFAYLLLFVTIGIYPCQSFAASRFPVYYPGKPERSSPVFSVIYGLSVTVITFAIALVTGASLHFSWQTLLMGLVNGIVLALCNLLLLRTSSMGPYSIVMLFLLAGGICFPMFYNLLRGVALPLPSWIGIGVMLAAFLLTSIVSYALGTSFGVVSTIGVILMTIARASGVSPVFAGGAILSGLYVGDRAAPASSCASLVASQTGTDVTQNIRKMIRPSLLPIGLCIALYGALSLLSAPESMDTSLLERFDMEIYTQCLVPAAHASAAGAGVRGIEDQICHGDRYRRFDGDRGISAKDSRVGNAAHDDRRLCAAR